MREVAGLCWQPLGFFWGEEPRRSGARRQASQTVQTLRIEQILG